MHDTLSDSVHLGQQYHIGHLGPEHSLCTHTYLGVCIEILTRGDGSLPAHLVELLHFIFELKISH